MTVDECDSAVRAALEDERFDWRSIKGIAEDTGLTSAQVEACLARLEDEIVTTISSSIGRIYTTRARYRRFESLRNRTLSAISGRVR